MRTEITISTSLRDDKLVDVTVHCHDESGEPPSHAAGQAAEAYLAAVAALEPAAAAPTAPALAIAEEPATTEPLVESAPEQAEVADATAAPSAPPVADAATTEEA